jgi:hypothetical protein
MKIGILTFHTAFNYGGMLQAYATQVALIKLGHEVQIIDYYPKNVERENFMREFSANPKQIVKYIYAKINPNVQKKFKHFNEFRSRMQLTARYQDKIELYQNPPEFDVYMVGSDQVWNMERGFDSFWFLDFIKDKLKISYASSFGTSTISKEYRAELKKQLTEFQAISVREADGVKIIEEATGLNATPVLDPTFLLRADEWISISSSTIIKGDYILCYGFDGSEKSKLMIDSIKKRLRLPTVAMTISLTIPYKADHFVQEAGPSEFLSLVKNAKFVCTSSYHGMALAINFRKSFIATIHPSRNSRMESMLSRFGLENRQVNNPIDILDMNDIDLFIDYSSIETQIENAISDSFYWLKSSLL